MSRKGRRSYLIESVDEALETGEVSDEFEDPHDSHNPDKPHYLTGLPHDLEILSRGCESGDGSEVPTCSPPITRSSMKGIIAKKSTKFMGCLKNLHFLGEHMNLTRYSIRKNNTIAFSEKNEIERDISLK